MKIEIPQSFQFCLAEHIAGEIHAAVVVMHLRVSYGIWPNDIPIASYDWEHQRIQDVRALIRSIRDKYDRRAFIGTVKYLFQKMREEKGTTVKWQDYVAGVRLTYADSLKPSAAA